MNKVEQLSEMATVLRMHAITATNASNSGHPTSCASAAELIASLFFHVMRHEPKDPLNVHNDRFVLSKGHAAPILYAAWAELGLFEREELLQLRKFKSILEGHPTPRLPFVDFATGSLGQGLSNACGMAYVAKYVDRVAARTYCLLGDGESAEGSVWEALSFAAHYELDNLCVIFDINRLGQSEPTALQHNLEVYRKRVEAFGLHTFVVDGHNVEALLKVFEEASQVRGKPCAVLARTFKGKDFPGVEDLVEWHGKPLGARSEAVLQYLKEKLKGDGKIKASAIAKPVVPAVPLSEIDFGAIRLSEIPGYARGERVSTRFAYGTGLAKVARLCPFVMAFDADTKNSTFSEAIKKVDAGRFVECFIAEQNMVGVAIGAASRKRTIPFVSTFSVFFTRAFDQIRMGAISQANVKFVGSHCGVSIGEDGPSQMGLEDLAMFRSVPEAVVFYPSDAVSCERAVELAARTVGICYIRTSRPNTDIVYANDEKFEIGKAKVVLKSDRDATLIVAGGVTLHEALEAAKILRQTSETGIRVIDLFCVKPVDTETLLANALECGGNVITVEDHYPEGGIGEAVAAALADRRDISVHRVAVRSVPRSGTPAELLDFYGLSAAAIAQRVKSIL